MQKEVETVLNGRTESQFLDWLMEMRFYNGFARYGQFDGHQVFVAVYCADDEIRDLVDELDSSDCPALEAAQSLQELETLGKIWIAADDNPVKAMAAITHKIADYYFNTLNGGKT